MAEKDGVPKRFANDELFQEVLKEALAIQDRFSAEPVYARTGKGYLKSVGVSELEELKKQRAPGREEGRD